MSRSTSKVAPFAHEKESNGEYTHFGKKWRIVRETINERVFDKKAKKTVNHKTRQWIPYVKKGSKYSKENDIEAGLTLFSVISKINVKEGYGPEVRKRTTGEPVIPKSIKE